MSKDNPTFREVLTGEAELSDEEAARLAAMTRKWLVHQNKAKKRYDQALARARRGDSSALPYPEPATEQEAQESTEAERAVAAGLGDLPGWLLRMGPAAAVTCDTCGSSLAQVWAQDVAMAGPRIVALNVVVYSPEPTPVADRVAWWCARCRGPRGLKADFAAAEVRERWRQRNATLTTSDVMPKVEVRATPVRLS